MHQLTLNHLSFLTDDFGIWQHTNGDEIDRARGYALDDAARALLVAIDHHLIDKADIYLRFLEQACLGARIFNFFDEHRQPLNRPASEDAIGETYWAAAAAIQAGFDREQVSRLLDRLKPEIQNFHWPRGKAYASLGASLVDQPLANRLASDMYDQFLANRTADWVWLEDELSYANAILPLSLLRVGRGIGRTVWQQAGLDMLRFLNEQTTENNQHSPIGNRGWFQRGRARARFDQQPIDPAYQILANVEAYQQTGEQTFLTSAKLALEWFWGKNAAKSPLIDDHDHCHDGISEIGVSANAGAENIVCYLLAEQALGSLVEFGEVS